MNPKPNHQFSNSTGPGPATPQVPSQQLGWKTWENKSPNNVFSWEAKGLFLGANLKDLGSLVVGNPYDDSD